MGSSRTASLWAGLAGLVAVGCAGRLPPLTQLTAENPVRVEITTVPFFSQDRNDCGPAALATVLSHSGVDVRPEDLEPQVYVPERQGSLQTEIVGATRRHDRLPYLVAPTMTELISQLASGHPVLVMQNLGLKMRPVWHYAVVVGYDAAADTVVLRSGTDERLVVKARRFDRSWARAGRWGLLALEAGTLPADPDLDRYLSAAAGLEAVGRAAAARAAYRSASREWPGSAWPWLGIANIAHVEGDLAEALGAYRQALARDPENVAARHNLAESLAELGCLDQARKEIAAALARAEGSLLESRVEETSRRLSAATRDGPKTSICSTSRASR